MRGCRTAVAGLALLLCGFAAAAQKIPATNAGQALELWLEIMNSGDPAKIAQYDKTYHRGLTPDSVALFRAYQGGGYRLLRVEKSEPNRIVARLAEKKTGEETIRVFSLDPADPSRLLDAGGGKLPLQRLSQTQALKAACARGDALAREDFFSGGLLIGQDGKILMEKVWGLADRNAHQPITTKTKFRLGSMNKMFTAVAALQLVGKGKLALDAPIGRYLPGYPNNEIATKTTIRMLLDHTGGTGDIFGPEFDSHRLQLKTLSDYVALYGNRAPLFAPGHRFDYSNYGYLLLGMIVEKVSGQSYYDYIDRNIFRPAGMADSGSLPESQQVPQRAAGYTRKGGRWISNAGTLPWRGSSAGGGYSTLEDMFKFAEALRAAKLLSPYMLRQATSPQAPGGIYGFGFGLYGEGADRHYGHNGGSDGMNGVLHIYPALGRVIVGLANMDPPAAEALVESYEQRMPLAR